MRDDEGSADGPDSGRRAKDEALARRAVQREDAAWSEIFEAHYRQVYAFVRVRVPVAAEAEDIASQVFEVAYTNAHRFDFRGLPIGAWLTGIARNLVRDHQKKAARRGPTSDIELATGAAEPDATGAVALRNDLAHAMGALTDDQQMVLHLRFVLDWPVVRTAEAMGRSEDAVKNLQRRALAAMQRALSATGYAPESIR